MKNIILITTCLVLLSVFRLQAQITTYPVQVYTQLIPPYTPYVPQYYGGTFPKLKVMIIDNDLQSNTLRVYLRMKIVSSMFSLTTPEYVHTGYLELVPGMPLELSLNDLAVYFRRENLRVSGNQSEFFRTLLLPDGFYRFHFEVYDAATNRLLSSPQLGFAQAVIQLGEPPVPQFPEKGKTISETPFPNIMFNWRPALNLPAGYNVEYEFSMAEIYDKKVNPEAAFTYSRILYTERTPAPSFIHSLSQPMLIPGMRYAWRVRAIAKQGIEETSIIKNNGFSQVFWFDYAADCNIVTTLGAIYENNKVNITWQDVNAMNYTVEYRKKGSSKWYTGEITQPELCTVYNLKNGTEYEYRVGSRCVINDAYQYSAIKGIKIPNKEDLQQERQRNCGIMPDTKITNRTPIEQLIPGQPVLAGDFPVFISKVSGSGRFSGEGYVGIPYIGNLKVAVTFKDIVVNTDNRLISGYFETKYDAVNNMTVDIDQTLTGGKGVGDVRTGEEKAAYTVDYNINPDIKVLPVKADGTKDEIAESGNYTLTKGENDKYVFIITDAEGKEHTVETDEMPATIEDKSGNTFAVDEKGTITPLSSKTEITLDPNTKNTPRPDLATLTFEATPNTKYAVDGYKEVYAKVTEYFLKYKPTTDDMIASAKFMVPGASDEIFVKVTDSKSGFNPDKVHFVTDKGKEYHGVYNTDKKGWTITLLGSAVDDGQHLYIVQEEAKGKYATLAKLNIYSYQSKRLKVKLVPVNGFTNGFTANNVATQLNAIYNKVGISCEVEMESSFDYEPLQTKAFDVTGSGLFSTLTDDMKAINAAYQEANPEDNAACLFIIENVTGADGVVGDMPRDKQFGYLFQGSTAQTIAHEIGHGIFHLDHPFDRANASKSFAKGDLADNLMEYSGSTNLVKIQWDGIHAPGLVIGVFETDEDGMKRVNLMEDYGDFHFGGSNEILQYLLKSKANEMINAIKLYDYFSITSNDRKMNDAVAILEDVFIRSKIKIGDPLEACSIVEQFAEIYAYKKIAERHEDILKLLEKNKATFPEKDVSKMIDDEISRLSMINIIAEQAMVMYKKLWEQYKNIDKVELSAFKNNLLTTNSSIKYTEQGLKNLLHTLSNTKFKDIVRSTIPGISNKEVQNLVNFKNEGEFSEKLTEVVKKLSQKNITAITQNLDDITLAQLRSTNGNFSLPANYKVPKFQILGNLLNFTFFVHKLESQDIDISDLMSVFPNPAISLASVLVKNIVNEQIIALNTIVFEEIPNWTTIITWNENWRGKQGIPNEPLYLYYTDQNTKCNPGKLPTSIMFTNKQLATEVFGFTPVYVDVDIQGQIRQSQGIYFMPSKQVKCYE